MMSKLEGAGITRQLDKLSALEARIFNPDDPSLACVGMQEIANLVVESGRPAPTTMESTTTQETLFFLRIIALNVRFVQEDQLRQSIGSWLFRSVCMYFTPLPGGSVSTHSNVECVVSSSGGIAESFFWMGWGCFLFPCYVTDSKVVWYFLLCMRECASVRFSCLRVLFSCVGVYVCVCMCVCACACACACQKMCVYFVRSMYVNWALVAVETQSQLLFVHHDPLESFVFLSLKKVSSAKDRGV